LARERAERRLAAILAADVAGYRRLMGADEEGTLARLKTYRRALVDPKIKQYRGRVVKTTRDGMLVEFASVIDAVCCAVEVQDGMVKRNAKVPPEKRINALITLARAGWGAHHPNFRQIFTGSFIPGATHEPQDQFNEMQRRTASAEGAARNMDVVTDFDITDLLDKVNVPTLVTHVRGGLVVPFEYGRELAAGIRGARFVALEGHNHLFLEHEPASARFFEEIKLFLGG